MGKADNPVTTVGDFGTRLSVLGRVCRPKTNREIETQTTRTQVDLTDTHRTPTLAEHIFFWSGHGTFSRMDKMLWHKARFHNYEKVQNIQSMFSDHSEMKLKINERRKIGKFTSLWKLNSTLLRSKWNESRTYKILCNVVTSVLSGKFMAVNAYKKTRKKTSNP